MFESLPEKDHSMLPTDDTPRWGAPNQGFGWFKSSEPDSVLLIRFSHVVDRYCWRFC